MLTAGHFVQLSTVDRSSTAGLPNSQGGRGAGQGKADDGANRALPGELYRCNCGMVTHHEQSGATCTRCHTNVAYLCSASDLDEWLEKNARLAVSNLASIQTLVARNQIDPIVVARCLANIDNARARIKFGFAKPIPRPFVEARS